MDNIYNYFEILLVLILIYYVYKNIYNNSNDTDNFTVIDENNTKMKNILLFDIEEIKDFVNGDKFKKLEHFLNNYNKSNDQLIDYTVNIGYKNYKGDIYIENMNNDMYNIYPKGSIVFLNINNDILNKYKTFDSFNYEEFYKAGEIPKEYVVANGNTIWYRYNDNIIDIQFNYPDNINDFIEFKPPNLINKFLLGYDHRNRNTTYNVNNKNIYNNGGEEYVKINKSHLPRHQHTFNINSNNSTLEVKGNEGSNENLLYNCNNNCNNKKYTKNTIYINPSSGTTDYSQNEISHNNIPPYKELIPIIKFI
jgi:hypothetical protein